MNVYVLLYDADNLSAHTTLAGAQDAAQKDADDYWMERDREPDPKLEWSGGDGYWHASPYNIYLLPVDDES